MQKFISFLILCTTFSPLMNGLVYIERDSVKATIFHYSLYQKKYISSNTASLSDVSKFLVSRTKMFLHMFRQFMFENICLTTSFTDKVFNFLMPLDMFFQDISPAKLFTTNVTFVIFSSFMITFYVVNQQISAYECF